MTRATMALTMLLIAAPGAGPPIRHAPRVVDRGFATRVSLCHAVPANPGGVRTNDSKLSAAEILGPELLELQVHQLGDGLADFDAAVSHLRRLLAQRPRIVSPQTPWAEATPLASEGILGTLRYTHGRTGRFEAAGMHLCFQDSAGAFWWMRLAAIDVWP
jgi:hypothetical protein